MVSRTALQCQYVSDGQHSHQLRLAVSAAGHCSQSGPGRSNLHKGSAAINFACCSASQGSLFTKGGEAKGLPCSATGSAQGQQCFMALLRQSLLGGPAATSSQLHQTAHLTWTLIADRLVLCQPGTAGRC